MTAACVNRVATAVPGFDMVLSGRVPSTIAAVAVINRRSLLQVRRYREPCRERKCGAAGSG